jgi:hypothetical protein
MVDTDDIPNTLLVVHTTAEELMNHLLQRSAITYTKPAEEMGC